jgi:hypothetical protein
MIKLKLFKISVIFLSLALFQFSNAKASCDFVENQPKQNRTTEKLVLMNFAKSRFGNFETGGNPKFYNGYHVWDLKRKNYVIYLRMNVDKNLWREELEISNYNFSEILNRAKNSDNILPKEHKKDN